MVTEWVLGLVAGITEWFVGIFPVWAPPTQLVTFDDQVNDWFDQFTGLGVWAPWTLMGVCLGISLLVYGIAFAAKGIRAIASYIPFFGGAG